MMKQTLKTLLICALATALLVSCGKKTNGEDESKNTSESASSVTTSSETTSSATTSSSTTAPNPTLPDIDTVKTPEQIYAEIEAAKGNMKFEMSVEMKGDMSSTVSYTTLFDGGKIYLSTAADFFGMTFTDESYLVKETAGYTYYYIGEDESWYRYSFEEDEEITSAFTFDFEDFSAYLKSENYGAFDSATNRYTMNEGIVIEEVALKDGYLEMTDNGFVLSFTELDEDYGDTVVMAVFSDFGKVTITLPEAKEEDPTEGEDSYPLQYPETAPTPEEIYNLIETSENVSCDSYSDLGGIGSISMQMEQDGNNIWMLISTTVLGETVTEETYLEKDGDTVYVYWVDENGNWIKEIADDEDAVDGNTFDFADLLKSENFEEYDPSTGSYQFVEGKTVTVEDLGTVTDATIVCYFDDYDDYYDIYMTVGGEDGISLTFLFSFYNFGYTEVVLPDANSKG
ncbi:MAG: hypothetical protein ACI3XR_05300 [Eubacteriales bacterium]